MILIKTWPVNKRSPLSPDPTAVIKRCLILIRLMMFFYTSLKPKKTDLTKKDIV